MDKRYHEAVEKTLQLIPQKSIAVIGDFFLDNYLIIDPALAEISLETGRVANQVVAINHSPGAAGTVTNNLAALGVGKIYAIGATGDDGAGYDLKNDLQKNCVDCRHLIKSQVIVTPTYTKPMKRIGEKTEEQERLDIKNRKLLPATVEEEILEQLDCCIREVDGLIIADQVEEANYGIITDKVRHRLIRLAAAEPDKIIFADSRARVGLFKNIIIKPNKYEAYRALTGEIKTTVSFDEAKGYGLRLASRTNRPVIVTLEKDGALVCQANEWSHIPGIRVTGEIDPVGAGDSFAAGLVAALCAGMQVTEACFIGSLVASITIQKIGTTGTASPAEIQKRNYSQQ